VFCAVVAALAAHDFEEIICDQFATAMAASDDGISKFSAEG